MGETPRQKEKDKKDDKERKQSCELDPLRFPPEDQKDEKKREKLREKNGNTLIGYCDQIFDAITTSINQFPISLR
jgi:hypothetical protein